MNLTPLLPLGRSLDRVSQVLYRRFVAGVLRRSGVEVRGMPLWVSSQTYFDVAFPGAIAVGDRCVISHGVRLLTHDFSLDRVAEAKHGVLRDELVRTGRVIIGDRSFIGMGVLVMPGVEIGDGAIVGAGSVVTKNVASNTVVAGNPARLVSTTDEYWDKRRADFAWKRRRR